MNWYICLLMPALEIYYISITSFWLFVVVRRFSGKIAEFAFIGLFGSSTFFLLITLYSKNCWILDGCS